jgi:hypothetical protein
VPSSFPHSVNVAAMLSAFKRSTRRKPLRSRSSRRSFAIFFVVSITLLVARRLFQC